MKPMVILHGFMVLDWEFVAECATANSAVPVGAAINFTMKT